CPFFAAQLPHPARRQAFSPCGLRHVRTSKERQIMPDRAPHPRPSSSRWRAVAAAFLTLLGGLTALLLPAAPADAASVSFTLGATRTDQNGNTLQLHGLGIIKVGNTWYGFGEDKTGETSTDTSFQDIPCYTSTDLA